MKDQREDFRDERGLVGQNPRESAQPGGAHVGRDDTPRRDEVEVEAHGPGGLGPSGLGPSGLGPSGLSPEVEANEDEPDVEAHGPAGLGPSGLGPSGLGPAGLGPSGL